VRVADKPSLGSLPEVVGLFTRGLEWLLKSSGAERAAILYGDDENEDPKVRAAYGVGSENFWENAPLSLTLLRDVRKSGQPIYLRDVPADPRYQDQLSLLLAGTGSLICIPFWGPTGVLAGLLYADTSRHPLSREHLQQALRLARWLDLRTPTFDGFMQWTLDLRREVGIPHTLAELGVKIEHLDRLAEMAAVDPTAGGFCRRLDFSVTWYSTTTPCCWRSDFRPSGSALPCSWRGSPPARTALCSPGRSACCLSSATSLCSANTPARRCPGSAPSPWRC